MTFIPGGRLTNTGANTSTSKTTEVPIWIKVTMGVVVANGLLGFGAWWFRGLFTLLLPAALAGLLIGWIRRAMLVRSKLAESFVSALFGAGWGKNNGLLLVLDLASRTLVGYGVGVAFAAVGAIKPDFDHPLYFYLYGGGPGGAGPDFGSWLLVVALLLVLAAIVGLLMTLASEGACWKYLGEIHLYFQSKGTQDAIRGTLKSMVKDTAAEVNKDYRHRQFSAGKSALKGAATGVLVGIVMVLLGLH